MIFLSLFSLVKIDMNICQRASLSFWLNKMEVEGTPSGKMAQGVQGQGFRTEGRLQDLKRNPVDRRRALTGRHLYNDERGVPWALNPWKHKISWS